MRTSAILLAGVALWFTLTVLAEKLFFPDDLQTIHTAMTVSDSSETTKAYTQLLKRGSIDLYLISPAIGIVVGSFVGLVQKYRPVLVASARPLPDLLWSCFANKAHLSTHSFVGLLRYLVIGSLPVLGAALAAVCSAHLTHSKTNQC